MRVLLIANVTELARYNFQKSNHSVDRIRTVSKIMFCFAVAWGTIIAIHKLPQSKSINFIVDR